jgi:outer membrane protein assembly factor BamB
MAYDQQTGATVWSAGDEPSSYSSPILATLCGQRQILIVGATHLVSHDPGDGHVLWRHPWPKDDTGSPNVSQPLVVSDDRFLLSKGYGVGCAMFYISRDDDGYRIKEVWANRNLKTKFTTVICRDGFGYGLDEGVLECVDLESGSKVWKQGKYGHGQVLMVGDLLLVQGEEGEVALVQATPGAFQEVARLQAIHGISWNTPALSGTKLLVRNSEEAACFELTLDTTGPGADDR